MTLLNTLGLIIALLVGSYMLFKSFKRWLELRIVYKAMCAKEV